MLRGSYAGGSLAVTARCPCRRPGPSAILHARVQAPGARLLGVRVRTVPAELRPRHSRLCYSSAHQCYSLPSHSEAEQGLRISSRLLASPSPFAALCCFSIAMRRIGLLRLSVAYAAVLCLSLALPRGATPSRDIAFQSRRPANLGGALPSPCHASLCLRHALLRFAFAARRTSKPSLRCPYRSIAVASRGFASP